MRVEVLPLVPELADRPLLAVGHEDRVVAEAAAPPRRLCDPPLHRAAAPQLLAAGRDRDELGDVARPPVLHAVELAEELRDRRRAFRRIARRAQAGPPPERGDLETGVLPDRPASDVLEAEAGLEPRVLLIGRAGLVRPVVPLEGLDPPTGEQ